MPSGIAVTPPVALRCLYEELGRFESQRSAFHLDLTSFEGVLRPPLGLHHHYAIGDAVTDYVAGYASLVVARAGLLASFAHGDSNDRLREHGMITRRLVAVEHSLATDLVRSHPLLPRCQSGAQARATLAIAAYWCDRDALVGISAPGAHPLLGHRPTDPTGAVLYDHAIRSWCEAAQAPPRRGDGRDPEVVELGLERLISAG